MESLRLLPPAYLVGRCATQQIQLGGFTLPRGGQPSLPASSPCSQAVFRDTQVEVIGCYFNPGTTVLVSPYLLHRDPRQWVQAQEFRPQRWLQYLEGAKPGAYMSLMSGLGPNGAYLPFGAGPRYTISSLVLYAALLSHMSTEVAGIGAGTASAITLQWQRWCWSWHIS